MTRLAIALLLASGMGALAQPAPQPASTDVSPPAPANAPAAAPQASAIDANAPDAPPAPPPPLADAPGTTLLLRGLDKITGRPTTIVAPIGKPVKFETLTITADYCYSTPPSETPETAAFLQIEDHPPEQKAKRIFSGWMYASSPSLNAVQHPLYDVWVLNCSNAAPTAPVAAMASKAPVKVAPPDTSDKDRVAPLPAGAGR